MKSLYRGLLRKRCLCPRPVLAAGEVHVVRHLGALGFRLQLVKVLERAHALLQPCGQRLERLCAVAFCAAEVWCPSTEDHSTFSRFC